MSKTATVEELPEILSVAQAAKALNLSPRTVLHRIEKGRIEATKSGPGTAGYWLTRAEVERVMQEDAA